jgi:thiamine-phosphate pyrophosphorylase
MLTYPTPLLYLIATTQTGAPVSHLSAVEAALAGGVGLVQMREKTGSGYELIQLGHELRRLTTAAGVPLVVNDHPDLARIIGADGVHVGQDDIAVADIDPVFTGSIGLSTHNMEQVRAGVECGADLLGVGPLFATTTKDAGKPVGLELVEQARMAYPEVTIIGIGGIDRSLARAVIQSGADGVAVCSAIMSSSDPESAARSLLACL